MSRGWQIGDLALCIKIVPWESVMAAVERPKSLPRPGAIYSVHDLVDWDLRLFLCFAGDEQNAFDAAHFRKVTPQEPDAFDRSVILALGADFGLRKHLAA